MIAHVPDLPLIADGAPARERADAARNRLRILEAAADLVDERGIEHVSMEDVACRAGVGTGTLYRRFGDRAGLALALLEEDTREFQDGLIFGPPPLGPGAPAGERLQAFGPAYIDLMERHADLLVAAGAFERDGRGPFTLYATHLAILIAEAAPELDAPLTARALLATLGPGHYLHARRALGWESERIKQGWVALCGALSSSSS
jgi:AcrR family transcriptional regulator